ncbi:unnamed protein product [Closterium sp. Naga37s-1]|nr:unnamed protein product [Closterium sp. Naga37s-1]
MIQGGARRFQEELEVWDPCLRECHQELALIRLVLQASRASSPADLGMDVQGPEVLQVEGFIRTCNIFQVQMISSRS